MFAEEGPSSLPLVNATFLRCAAECWTLTATSPSSPSIERVRLYGREHFCCYNTLFLPACFLPNYLPNYPAFPALNFQTAQTPTIPSLQISPLPSKDLDNAD